MVDHSVQSAKLTETSMLSSKSSPRRTLLFVLAAIFLLGTLAGEEWLSIRHLSMTADEGAHLYAGYQHWRARDFGVNPEHPPLVKLVAALPLLGMQLRQPHPPPINFLVEQYMGGDQLLNGNDPEDVLLRGRIAVSLLTLILGCLVLSAGCELFGWPVGLLALFLFTFEPTVLANSALVTTDMGVACFTFASAYTFYRFMQRPGILRLVVCGLAVGLAFSAKVSGVIAIPILAVMAGIEIAHAPTDRARRAVRMSAVLLAIGGIGYVVLWSFYTFRYAARPGGLVLTPTLSQLSLGLASPWQTATIQHLAAWHLFPEAYLFAWTKLVANVTGMPGFLFGHIYPNGTWFYFPATLLVKSTITLLLLAAAAPFVLRHSRKAMLFLALPFTTILLLCLPSTLNIGVRHILPIYPFAILLAAASAWTLARRSRVAAYAIAALFAFQCISSLHAYPDYLPYANEAFGGSSNTYRLLTDSNVDWAQQLKEVNAYLAARNIHDCWFAYSLLGGAPAHYQIPCKPLPTGLALVAAQPQPIVPIRIRGTILVSALDASGAIWGPGDRNPYRQFQDGHPAELIGNSILVYRGDYDVHLAAAESHASQAPLLLRMHQENAALSEVTEAIQLAPESPALQAVLGGTLLQMGRKQDAEQAFAKALQQARDHHPDDESAEVKAQITRITHPPF